MAWGGQIRGVARNGAALAVTGLALLGVALAGAATASAASLPPVQITYSGSMSIEVFPTVGKPSHQLRTVAWTATASSAGSDGSLALDFSSVSGSASIEGTGNCYDSTTTLSLATAKNPVAGDWFLNETSDFPSPGWKYIALGVPEFVPVLEDETGRCSSLQDEELPQINEMLLKQETFSPAQLKEYEAILEPFEFTPGRPATRTRTFSFDGISHCTCLPTETHVKESMTLTVSATSPASGNNIKTRSAPGGGGSGPKGTPTRRKKSEALRKALKEQAEEELGPALERAWAAHGLSLALGLNSGLAFSTVLTELGQTGLLEDGDETTTRVINDYRIINDPPDHRFHQLAKPHTPKRSALHSCATIPSAERTLCTSLRDAETAMLGASAQADAITEAMLVTMNRDSTAIRARDYTAAQRQYVHFESLHGQLHRVLKMRGSSGARVAAILRGVGVSGVLSSAQSASAIGAVEAKLSRARIPAAKLEALAKGALDAHETNALESLASPTG
ncbi:MAG TPA: hypothetical protein VH061_09790 [Solirubrobacteraceae bacterium]|jgi:hypothetical protein|nr:hypothetical protein [Solirubrobacteraceae bacterium]